MTDLRSFDQIRESDTPLVGGKGLSLGLLASAGLPVPDGFCLTTEVHRRLRGKSLHEETELLAALRQAYDKLGPVPVAVRSSATAEDGAVTSFAGQQETILGVSGLESICRAVEQCWASLESERATAYRRQQGIRDDDRAMAVVVQRLIEAETAGVLFTRDPLDPSGRQMLVESAWGLGETVVSGKVMPDRYHLDRETGKVCDRHIAMKTIKRTLHGEEPVPEDRRTQSSLTDDQLQSLAKLARQVEAYHGEPRDVEWAYAEGRFWLLQSRPITAGGQGDLEQLRQEEISRLREKASRSGTVWSRFNLAEVLPTPTPMTWAIVSRYLMSGKGGFGRMYRDLGYDPDPSIDDEGIFDLVCGRPYCNLTREPRLHYREIPFEHSFRALKKTPQQALYPTPTINLLRFPARFWLLFPYAAPRLMLQLATANRRQEGLLKTFAGRFREDILPNFVREVKQGAGVDLTAVDAKKVQAFLHLWIEKTLIEFAQESLKPTALAALAMSQLEQTLTQVLGAERAREFTRMLVMGVHPEPNSDLALGIRDLANGRMNRDTFLSLFGHRGSEEMELSRPRWAEDSSTLEPFTQSIQTTSREISLDERLASESKLNAEQRRFLMPFIQRLHTYLALRETAKNALLLGYAQIRRALVELDQRFHLEGGIFYLLPEELDDLLAGKDFAVTIAQRRRKRALLLGMEVPTVIFSDDLEAIGRPAIIEGAESLQGVPLSAGVSEGPALVLEHPHVTTPPGEDYILVCPTTDPAWVPLFVRARGLVMETGGVLSHGAIVAREFGLPAVAGLPGVLKHLRTGQRIRVDGGQGRVTLLE